MTWVAERNTCGRCGYALCERPHAKQPGTGAWKLVNVGRRDFAIAPRAELERWCSPACARRAMYVRVQLTETAAWSAPASPRSSSTGWTKPTRRSTSPSPEDNRHW